MKTTVETVDGTLIVVDMPDEPPLPETHEWNRELERCSCGAKAHQIQAQGGGSR